MITNRRKLDEFYRKLDAKDNLSVKQAFRIYDERIRRLLR